MKRIARKLNCKYDPSSLQLLNFTERDQRVPYELQEEFIEKKPLVYAVYHYVLSKYTQQNSAPDGNSAALYRR
jgi:hypothetical protein